MEAEYERFRSAARTDPTTEMKEEMYALKAALAEAVGAVTVYW